MTIERQEQYEEDGTLKTLANGLKNAAGLNLPKEVIEESIAELGKGAGVRGETLTLEEFAQLCNSICHKK